MSIIPSILVIMMITIICFMIILITHVLSYTSRIILMLTLLHGERLKFFRLLFLMVLSKVGQIYERGLIMYRGCRRLVCSLVCVFSILFMLFLDTCTVEAASEAIIRDDYTISFSLNLYPVSTDSSTSGQTITINGTDGTVAGAVNGTININSLNGTNYGTLSSGSNIITMHDAYTGSGNLAGYLQYGSLKINQTTGTISGGTTSKSACYDLEFDFPLTLNLGSLSDLNSSDYYLSRCWYQNATCSVGSLTSSYITFSDTDCSELIPWTYYQFTSDGSNILLPSHVHGHIQYYSNSLSLPLTVNFTYTIDAWLKSASEGEYNLYQTHVSDIGTQSAINNNTSVAQDTNTTTHSIFNSISDFFGSFFDNLLHIFVPEDGYFSTWFDKVNTLLSDKLGMLYAPFDLVISTLQAIYSSSTTESGIPFPGIKWEDTWLVEPFTFTFASLGSDFDDLRDKVYFATDTVLVLTFLMLLQSKVKLILEGHE